MQNEGKHILLTKGNRRLLFDQEIKAGRGYLNGVKLLPLDDWANPALSTGKTVNIQEFHETMGHTNEESLRLTAKARGLKLSGKLESCESCHLSKAKKKDAPKTSESQSETPGERLMLDSSSSKQKSFGGRDTWLLVMDQATRRNWSYFLKAKSDIPDKAMELLKKLIAMGYKVKYLRMDNAGENKKLAELMAKDMDLCHIQM